jgi:uncharacterized protein DUF4382
MLLAVWLTGCGNTCLTFSSNPPTGTLTIKASNPNPPSCKLATVNGAVRVQMATDPACSSCATSSQIQHIFVTILGIEIHPSTTADDDSPDWQELLPSDLTKHPLQVDLVGGAAGQSTREPLGEIVAIPAGIYRQVRLRFAPNELPTHDQVPERNGCGSRLFNCVVLADDRIQPLQLDRSSSEVQITSNRIEGGSLFIAPDTDTNLTIELRLVWAWFSSPDEGLHVLPMLAGSAKVSRNQAGIN